MSQDKSNFYVYAYLYPNGEPFYIGKGKGKRDTNHLRICQTSDACPEFYCELRMLLKQGFQPTITRILDNLTESEAYVWEVFFVAALGQLSEENGPLTNRALGGALYKGRPSEKTKLEWALAGLKMHLEQLETDWAIWEKFLKTSAEESRNKPSTFTVTIDGVIQTRKTDSEWRAVLEARRETLLTNCAAVEADLKKSEAALILDRTRLELRRAEQIADVRAHSAVCRAQMVLDSAWYRPGQTWNDARQAANNAKWDRINAARLKRHALFDR